MMEIVFWVLVGLVLFAFVGFPVCVIGLGALLHRRYRPRSTTPAVSVVVAAYNEATGIAAKIRNTLASRYPGDCLEVIVVDDGSTDGTGEEVERLADPRVHLLRQDRRGGKIAALNRGVPRAGGDILVFTDANAELEPDALVRLVEPFADPSVGGVCGNQLNLPGQGALARGEHLYWEYDKLLKRMESLTGSIVAADGSIYAIRREHFEPIPPGVTDDFFVSTGVVRDGARLVFTEGARSSEAPLEKHGDHLRRRIRITQQAMQSLASRHELMNPFRYGVYAFVLTGHKLFRRLAAPAILLLLPVTLLVSSGGVVYQLALLGQLLIYGAAAGGWLLRGRGVARHLAAPTYFVLGVVGTTVGMMRYLLGQRSHMWEPVRR